MKTEREILEYAAATHDKDKIILDLGDQLAAAQAEAIRARSTK